MKKTFLLAATLLGMSSAAMAQSSIDTYDACDANLNGEIMVDDATTVVNRVLGKTPSSEVVKAEDLNALLQLIDSRLSAIEANNDVIKLIDSRLSAIEAKLGIEAPGIPDANGVISNGYDYVDLGLKDSQGRTIYWATCNVGAENPEDHGLYFAWGETEGYTEDTTDDRKFDWASYKFMQEDKSDWQYITKYTFADDQKSGIWYDGDAFVGDGKKVLDPEDDAAHVNWKGDWRMPTYDELDWLKDNCTWTWDSAKNGYTVKSSNGNSIFLPTAGDRSDSDFGDAGSLGCYWSSSLTTNCSDLASYLYFNSDYPNIYYCERYYGQSVRPVCVPSK